jgi:predicted RNase H-like HicB family nuclease
MAIFIAIVRSDADFGYTASFPDFPGCAVGALTVELVIAKAKEALALHIGRLLEANQKIAVPTAAGAINPGDALLIAAVEVPDDLRIARVNLAIPALSLARIDSFARRHGLTRSTLFVEAVDRWAMQESLPRERRGGVPDGPTLFDFANPLELRVEKIAASVASESKAATQEPNASEQGDIQRNVDDITAELVRLLEERPEPLQIDRAGGEQHDRPTRKAE